MGMGIIPLQYLEGENAEKLTLTGKELFSVEIPQDLKPGQELTVKVNCNNYPVSLDLKDSFLWIVKFDGLTPK